MHDETAFFYRFLGLVIHDSYHGPLILNYFK